MADDKPAEKPEKEEAKPEAAPAEEAAKAPETPPRPPIKLDLGVIIVVAAAVLVLIGVPTATYMVIKSAIPPPVEVTAKEEDATETVLALKSLVVNIAQTKGTRMLKFEPHVVLSNPELASKLRGDSQPILVDRIIQVVAQKSLDELEGAEARERLKEDIRKELNTILKDKMSGTVVDVYFNEYIIQ